ncbi:DsbA family oxidoreductase [Streptomyces prunicolor]|uniref:DsbA family oxidoreductase n=1 Tax=Streptomyces prunicolor TaxID=67348 RepID=UPI003435B871
MGCDFPSVLRSGPTVFGLDGLLDLADELDLEREKTRHVLTEGRYRRRVQDEAHQARRPGATGAPFIVIDSRYAIPGAEDTDTVLGVLREVRDETHPIAQVTEDDAPACGPDGCAVLADHPAHA